MSELKKDSVQVKINKDPFVGQTLGGKYEVLELIGSGAMGALYLGKHLALDRPVAIKVLHAHLAQDDVHMERFVREAKLAASLQHSHVAHVYDVGNAEDGAPYLVMDFLDGRSLQKTIDELGPMPVRRAVPLMIQIAQGLSYAHSKGLLHRDLKLGNIMVVSDVGQEMAKIIDFGIAKSMNPDEASKLTQTGEIFGSPLYMSPEQCQGLELDERSDIYSLGCVMYEMLSGVPALRGDSLVSTIYKHINEAPKPIAEAAPGVRVPAELEAIVFKCLEKDKSKRYANANDIVVALQKVAATSPAAEPLEQTVVAHSSMTPSEETGTKVRNNFVIMLGALLTLGAGAVAYFVTHPLALQKTTPDGKPVVAEYVINGEKVQYTKDNYNGDDASPVVWKNTSAGDQPAEVLMVYTHQTSTHPRSMDINYEIYGDADVHIKGTHGIKPVILVLGGFAPTRWHVKTDPGVKLQKVIASGYLQQQVDGVPNGVEVVESSDSLPPDKKDRPNQAFKPFGDLSNLGRGEDATQNSTVTEARETIKKLTGGNDITELHATSQMHSDEI
jgi:serine/threonine protein kinase